MITKAISSTWMSFIQSTADVEASMEGRWLDETNTTSSSDEPVLHDSSILRDMTVVYGSILLIAFFLFCYVRRAFPRPYTVRKWTDKDDLKVR